MLCVEFCSWILFLGGLGEVVRKANFHQKYKWNILTDHHKLFSIFIVSKKMLVCIVSMEWLYNNKFNSFMRLLGQKRIQGKWAV